MGTNIRAWKKTVLFDFIINYKWVDRYRPGLIAVFVCRRCRRNRRRWDNESDCLAFFVSNATLQFCYLQSQWSNRFLLAHNINKDSLKMIWNFIKNRIEIYSSQQMKVKSNTIELIQEIAFC